MWFSNKNKKIPVAARKSEISVFTAGAGTFEIDLSLCLDDETCTGRMCNVFMMRTCFEIHFNHTKISYADSFRNVYFTGLFR